MLLSCQDLCTLARNSFFFPWCPLPILPKFPSFLAKIPIFLQGFPFFYSLQDTHFICQYSKSPRFNFPTTIRFFLVKMPFSCQVCHLQNIFLPRFPIFEGFLAKICLFPSFFLVKILPFKLIGPIFFLQINLPDRGIQSECNKSSSILH